MEEEQENNILTSDKKNKYDLNEGELIGLFESRLNLLERKLKRSKSNIKALSILAAALTFTILAILLVFSVIVVILPYLYIGRNIPIIVSYIAAFAVLIFIFFLYQTYQYLLSIIKFKRVSKPVFEDVEDLVEQAHDLLSRLSPEKKKKSY